MKKIFYLLIIISTLVITMGCGTVFPNEVPITITLDENSAVDELVDIYIKATSKDSGYRSSNKATLKKGESADDLTLKYYGSKTEVKIYASFPISGTEYHTGSCSVSDIENTEPKKYTVKYDGTSLSCN